MRTVDPETLVQQIALIDEAVAEWRGAQQLLRRDFRRGRLGRRPKVRVLYHGSVARMGERARLLEGAAHLLSVIRRDLEESGECILQQGKERR